MGSILTTVVYDNKTNFFKKAFNPSLYNYLSYDDYVFGVDVFIVFNRQIVIFRREDVYRNDHDLQG